MTKRNIITGIDVGSKAIKVVICDASNDGGLPSILGTGSCESRGFHRGYVTNTEDAGKSIRLALSRAEKEAGTKVSDAFFSAGSIGLEGEVVYGSALVSQATREVSKVDIDRACTSAEKTLKNGVNKSILHVVPLAYKLDGKDVLGQPFGMKGAKIEVKVLVIAAQAQHINNLIEAADIAGVEVDDIQPSSIAASYVTLSKRERMAGCVLVDIGAETTTITVFEDELPLSLQVLPVGSMDITNDIALAMRISLTEAEKLKLSRYGGEKEAQVEKVVETRLNEIFRYVEEHLKKLGRNGLLPAGVIFLGGGAGHKKVEDLAKGVLCLPTSKATLHFREHEGVGKNTSKQEVTKKDSFWAVAYGLCILGYQNDGDGNLTESIGGTVKGFGERLSRIFKQFLP